MQAIELLSAFVRSADALERIANSMEILASGGEIDTSLIKTTPAYNNPDLIGGGQGPETVGGETKRKRRTKAEIEAEKAANSTNPVSQGVTLPPAVTAALDSTPPFNVTAQTTAVNPTNPEAGYVQSQVPPIVQQPVVQQPAVDPVVAQYAALPVENQFGVLLNTFGPHNNQAYVRDALVNTLQQYGLSLPISDPADRALPGAGYRALGVEQRIAIFGALTQAINAVTAAQQPGL